MISSFRRLTKSKVGMLIAGLFLLLIAASFALTDMSSVMSGGLGGQQSSELAEVGGVKITDRDIDAAMQRRLAQVRQTNPEATYADIAGDFDAILGGLIEERALQAFARQHGFNLSKRLVDAEIAAIPAARGLDGQFSEQAYLAFLQQQRLTDQEVRQAISTGMLQQLLIAPVAANARAPVGMARPYASMLLEQREGHVAFIPIEAFRAGLNPTPAQVQQYYQANQERYTVPEQRVLRIAEIGPERVASVQATEQEVEAYYRQNQAQYAAKDLRTISQAVAQDRAAAQAIADRAKAGQSLAAAAAPAGANVAVSSLESQSKQQYAGVAGEAAANAVFGGSEGAVVGPVQSDFGWIVAKVESIQREGGQTLAEARDEIAATLTANKRKEALIDLVTRIEDQLAEGASFAEAVASARLNVVETPLITASGASRVQPDYKLPEQFAPALGIGFEMAENDEPVVETLPDESGYLLVAPSRIVPAAPAPLAEIRERVASDWITAQATVRARSTAQAIEKRAAASALTEAAEAAPVDIPVEPVNGRRLELARFQGRVPPALGLLFSLGKGKARMVAGAQGEGFYVVKVNEIVPGNALTQPALIAQTQQQLQEALAQEYVAQFLAAVRNGIGVTRNEEAIAEARQRLTSGN